MTSADFLERFLSLHPKLIDLSLGRIERLLAALGHPERKIPPVFHVAGTNGKGSVGAILRALLAARGFRVQAYTSPHLVTFHERIRLSDGLIGEARLEKILARCEAANKNEPITFFEATTAAAFCAFAEDEADYCILEVGLGGVFDATNVIDNPLACLITPVALDHQHFLGETIAAIAREKAGIIKAGTPVFCAAQDPDADREISARARQVGAPLFKAGEAWALIRHNEHYTYEDRFGALSFVQPALAGAHQADNAAQALACLRAVGLAPKNNSAITQALAAIDWPARLQPLTTGPLAALRREKGALWLDGGHNPHAAAAIAAHFAGTRLHLVIGMLENRDPDEFLKALKPVVKSVAAVPIEGEAAHTPEHLAARATALGLAGHAYKNVADALASLPEGDVLIVGSLYLAGKVLAESGLAPA